MNLSKKKKIILALALIVIFLLGIFIMAYPYVSAQYAEKVRSIIQTEYEEVVEDPAKAAEINTIRDAAVEYNHKLYSGLISPLEPEENGYYEQLSVEGSDIMCYIRIPTINVSLPVYHGIGEAELAMGAGHMPQTSLPVGGTNTHTVISAHSGMASSPMFTDIGLLEIGDLVYIDVLGETLTYQVYQEPVVVLPYEVENVKIQSDKDLLTLVTCTPINVNSHRLLVHCERIETVEEAEEEVVVQEQTVENPSVYAQTYMRNIYTGLLLGLFIILVAVVVIVILRKRSEKENHENEK